MVAIKCFECNSKLDPRCGEPFDNFTIALVDCEQQRENDIPHLGDEELAMWNREVDEEGNPVENDGENKEVQKAVSFCRKTLQTSKLWPLLIGHYLFKTFQYELTYNIL